MVNNIRKILLLIICLAILSFVGYRVYVCNNIYSQASETLNSATFDLPKKIKPEDKFEGKSLNLGYATLLLPTEDIESISVLGEGWAVQTKCDTFELITMRPLQTDPSVFDTTFIDNSKTVFNDSKETMKRLTELKKKPNADKLYINLIRDYRWMTFALNIKQRSFMQLFLSSSSDMELYGIKLLTRGNRFSKRGIDLLETEWVNAIIYLGDPEMPGEIMADIWSKNGKISQSVRILSKSWDSSQDAIKQVISTYRYTSEAIPEEDEIKQFIMDTMSKHEKYKLDKDPKDI